MRQIERVRVGQVWIGESVCDVDDEELINNLDINLDYDAEEQDWHTVADRRGHADTGQLLLETHNGERYWTPMQSWEQWTWRLVGDDGEPVIDTEVRDRWRDS